MNRALKISIAKICLPFFYIFSKISEIFRTKLSYKKALKNIKEVYDFNIENYAALKGLPLGKENLVDVSFIVPVYNVEKYLERCVRSILNQKTSVKYEIICVNDGSTDKSLEILEKLQRETELGKFKIISQKNAGSSAARNTGIVNAKGKYLAFVDSDDFIDADYIEILWKKQIQTPADLIQCSYKSIDENGNLISIETLTENWIGFAWSGIWKRSLFEKISFPYGFWYEDMIVTFLFPKICRSRAVVNGTFYNYVIRKSSISHLRGIKTLDQLSLPFLIFNYSKEILNLKDDIFLYKRLLHELSKMLWNRTKGLSYKVRKSAFVVASTLLRNYIPDNIFEADFSSSEIRVQKAFSVYSFIKWNMNGYIELFENILEVQEK